MTIMLVLLLICSLAANVVFIWYTRKLLENLHYGIKNVDEMQKLLEEYASLLEPLSNMENFYNDPALSSAIANTKLVIQTCKVYKNAMLESANEETEEIKEANKKDEEAAPQRTATIGSIGS